MGKRGLTKKEIEFFLTHPKAACIFFGIMGVILGFILLCFETGFEGLAAVCFVIGAILIVVFIVLMFIPKANATPDSDEYENSSGGRSPVQTPKHRLLSVDFIENTRACHIEILETTTYRTIERYVTRNYVKYPIYSPWKTKEKRIKLPVIKLTNEALENLDKSQNGLVCRFAFEILSKIGIPELYPSWYLRRAYEIECKELCDRYEREKNECLSELRRIQHQSEIKLSELNKLLHIKNGQLPKAKTQRNIARAKAIKAKKRKKSIFLSIITFGIYAYLTSSAHLQRLDSEARRFEETYASLVSEISSLKKQILNIEETLRTTLLQIEKEPDRTEELKRQARDRRDIKIAAIVPLCTSVTEIEEFTPLKQVIGLAYKKIVGIYVIKNNENGKHYVGQSKDVIRRIKQHFKGTEPHNIIFAEDYYFSSYPDKSELFSIKIIECERGELDQKEKEYIALYDAYQNGYNQTQGNN